MAEEKLVRRPFHETIVDVIRETVNLGSNDVMSVVGTLLMDTKIPKGHDEIVVALKERFPEVDPSVYSIPASLIQDVLAQKKEVEAEERVKAAKHA